MPAELADEVEWFSRLQLFARALTAGLGAEEIMEIVVQQGIAGVDAEGGVLALLDSDVVIPVVTVGYAKDRIQAFGRLSINDDLPLTAAARDGLPVFVTTRDEVAARFPAMASKPALSHAWSAIPLVANNRTIGVLGLSFASMHEFDERERLFLCSLADLTAIALASGVPDENRLAGPSAGPPDGPADLGLIQRVLIYLFEVSFRLISISVDPRTYDDMKHKLLAIVEDLDDFGRGCRRDLFPADFSPNPAIRATKPPEIPRT